MSDLNDKSMSERGNEPPKTLSDKLKDKYRNRDKVVRVITDNGFFRAAAIRSTNIVRHAQESHNLDGLSAYFLGNALSATALMSSFLKGEERVILQVSSSNYLSSVYAEAVQVGEVRGFVRRNVEFEFENMGQRKDVLGDGLLKVSRILYNKHEPVTGIVNLVSGDLSGDLAHYLLQSEQIPSAVVLNTELDDNGKVVHAGGIIVQAMPGALQEMVQAVEQRIALMPSILSLLGEGAGPEALLEHALPYSFEVIASTPTDFFCRCTIDRFKSVLATMGSDQIREMRSQNQNELVCQYCSKKYVLEPKDYQDILEQISVREN